MAPPPRAGSLGAGGAFGSGGAEPSALPIAVDLAPDTSWSSATGAIAPRKVTISDALNWGVDPPLEPPEEVGAPVPAPGPPAGGSDPLESRGDTLVGGVPVPAGGTPP